MNYLLDRGADLHARNDYALYISVMYGNYDAFNLLINRGANIRSYAEYSIPHNDIKIKNYLQSKGVKIAMRGKKEVPMNSDDITKLINLYYF